MSTIKFNPDLFLKSEKLIYKPNIFAAKGQAEITLQRLGSAQTEVSMLAKVTLLGGITVIDMFTKVTWVLNEGQWLMSKYIEDNKKSGNQKIWQNSENHQCIDPISLLFSFKGCDLESFNQTQTQNILVGGKKEIKINFVKEDDKIKKLPFLGKTSRPQLDLLISSDERSANMCIDKDLKIPTEFNLKVPVVGSVQVNLVEKTAN